MALLIHYFLRENNCHWPNDASRDRIITTHPAHHNNRLHKDFPSKKTLKKNIYLPFFFFLIKYHTLIFKECIWGWDIWMFHLDTCIGSQIRRTGIWSVLLWQSVEDTNTSWLWAGKVFFQSQIQEHGPHLVGAPFHQSALMPVVSPAAGELIRTAYLSTHTSRLKALNHFLHEADSGCNWLWMELWQQCNYVQKSNIVNWD